MIANNMLELVGNTPMVKINNIVSKPRIDIYLKLEKFNPGGSIKDRIAKYMIEHAEREGILTKDKIVIEPTSGNTGIGLAIACAVKGYRLVLVMPETMTMERRKILMVHGAQIILSPSSKGMNGAEDFAKQIVDEDPEKYFMPNQFSNKYNVLAHQETTAEEIWSDTKGKINHFVAGIGTSGTLMGVSRNLKKRNPAIKIIAVEPDANTPIQGLKNLETQYVPLIFNKTSIDETHYVKLADAEETARVLALKEGIFCGPSTGAILHVALNKATQLGEGVMVAMAPDGGEKYLSTELCDIDRCRECIERHGGPCAFMDKDIKPRTIQE